METQSNTWEQLIQLHKDQIYNDFVHLTQNILQKDMKSANKQLQDTLMNYFLENQVRHSAVQTRPPPHTHAHAYLQNTND